MVNEISLLEKPTDLAYNSTADKFLVVWQENSSGTWQIWGRHLLNNGGGMETAVLFLSSLLCGETAVLPSRLL